MAMRVAYPHFLGIAVSVVPLPVLGAFNQVTRAMLEARLPDWKARPGTGGQVLKIAPRLTADNIAALAELHGWRARYNEMTKRVELKKPGLVVPDDDHENTALTIFGDDVVRADMPRIGLDALVDAVATSNRYHPVRDWIEATPWDRVYRCERWHETLKLADPEQRGYRSKIMDKWALQCIAALCEPCGIASPGILTLVGPQHTGKTYWFANLCPVPGAIGTGLNLDPSNKDSILKVVRFWVGELGELESTTRRADVGALKAFISNDVDVVRLPYARRDTSYKRRTVLGGSVNGTGFLVDETGNRRFWVLAVTGCDVLPPDIQQQVWAEYLHRYQSGERWHLDPELLEAINANNVDHTAVDPVRERIARAWDWESVDWSTIDAANHRAFANVVWLTATEVCIRSGIDNPTKLDATRAGSIIKSMHRANAASGQGISGSRQGITGPKQGISLSLERKSNGVKLLAVPASRSSLHPR